MTKKKIFLTGSSGFIGRNILEKLGSKYDFIAPAHKELNLLNTLAVDKFFAKKGPFEAVVHCAFIGGPRSAQDSDKTLNDNLRIFFNLVRNERFFNKFINLGSGAEYGKQKPLVKVSEHESDKVQPENTDHYGFAKYIISKYIEGSEKIVNLRLFGIYGKYEDYTLRFISNAICKSVLKMPLTIKQNVYFEYLFVSDLVRIIDYFLTHKVKWRTYNIGRGKPIDLAAIARKINRIAGDKLPIIVKQPGLAYAYTCDNKRLLIELGNFEFTDFDDSLKKLYAFYLKKRNILERKSLLFDD